MFARDSCGCDAFGCEAFEGFAGFGFVERDELEADGRLFDFGADGLEISSRCGLSDRGSGARRASRRGSGAGTLLSPSLESEDLDLLGLSDWTDLSDVWDLDGFTGLSRKSSLGARADRAGSTDRDEAGSATATRRPLMRAVSIRAGAVRMSLELTRWTRAADARSTWRSSRPEFRTTPFETGKRVTFWLRARRTWFSCTGTLTFTTLTDAKRRVGTKQYQLRFTVTGEPK